MALLCVAVKWLWLLLLLGRDGLKVKASAATPLHNFIHVTECLIGQTVAPQPSFVAMYLHLLTLAVLPPHDANTAMRGLCVVVE
jgi:hypothetical protein